MVAKWRKLHNGVVRNGKLVRYSLEAAANMVGISKKSLDDYLLQLRFGKKYNFNFAAHSNSKAGELRTFVKRMKAQERKSISKTHSQI